LGVVVALAMLVALALPLWSDIGALTAKAGADFPTLRTLARVISIFCGGLPDPVTAAIVALAAYGALRLARADARLAAYLAALAIVPATFVFIVGAKWTFQAHTFARYVMPAQAILLFWAACGAMGLVRAIVERPGARWTIAAALALAYVAANPALSQVVRLREWYGHLYHHYDYADSRNVAVRQYDGFQPPDFYRKLGAMPEASAPIIEAPFTYEAPANVFAFFALFHRQPEKMGMLHGASASASSSSSTIRARCARAAPVISCFIVGSSTGARSSSGTGVSRG
jgi:hypothetical protein